MPTEVSYEVTLATLSEKSCQKFLVACATMGINIRSSFSIMGNRYALNWPKDISMVFSIQLDSKEKQLFEDMSGTVLKQVHPPIA